MKIVRPYGISITNERKYGRRLKKNGDLENPNIVGFQSFNSSDPRILVAQWISVIDKIFRKPNQDSIEVVPYVSREKVHTRKKQSPTRNDLLRKQQIEIREKLGQACWSLLSRQVPEVDWQKWESTWDWKLNPAGTDYTQFKNDKWKKNRDGNVGVDSSFELPVKGRWYSRFLGEMEIAEIDCEELAEQIQLHLHQDEQKIGGGFRKYHELNEDGSYTRASARGVIEARAVSVAENSLAARIEKRLSGDELKNLADAIAVPGWSNDDKSEFSIPDDLASEIFHHNLELEEEGKRIQPSQAGELIFAHYGQKFADNGIVPKRQEIAATQPGLLNLYDAVRKYYKRFLSSTKKRTPGAIAKPDDTSKISTVLPRNDEELFARLEHRSTNAVTNDLIRLGRVLHYESSPDEGDKFGLKSNKLVWEKSKTELVHSRYWTSEGQSEVKRTEAFVRVWRHTLSQAARTAQYLADPYSDLIDENHPGKNADIALANVARAAASRITQGEGNKKLQLHLEKQSAILFGKQAKLFTEPQFKPNFEVNAEDFLYSTLRLVGNMRNRGFHFKGRKYFISNMKASLGNPSNILSLEKDHKGYEAMVSAMQQLLSVDQDESAERLWKTCEGAHINRFLNESELEKFLRLISGTKETNLTLPKFNTLLLRLKNTNKLEVQGKMETVPEPASAVELLNPALQAKFVSMKLLYEKPFRAWLDHLPIQKLSSYIEAAMAQGTKDARKINGSSKFKDLIEAKSTKLPKPESKDTVQTYMEKLQAEQASEMRVQSGYESDPAKARKQMEWIENFRRDIIGYAYRDFLLDNRNDLISLLQLSDKIKPLFVVPRPSISLVSGRLNETWHALIYYLLHLVPVDDVSRLLHQFRKWGVLEVKSGKEKKEDEDVDALMRIFTLFLEMHDDKHDGEGVDLAGLEHFSELFENGTAFKAAIMTEGSTKERLTAIRRGLREVIRFGHFGVLKQAARLAPVTMADISDLAKLENPIQTNDAQSSEIAQAQLRRKNLHTKIMTGKGWGQDEVEEYATILGTIRKHRELASRVRLTNHIRLHRLMMRVVSRLVDYAGLWERDGYFITLALMFLHEKQPDQVLLKYNDQGSGKEIDAAKLFCDRGALPNSEGMVDDEFRKILSRFHSMLGDEKGIRNDLAHFNIMATDDVDLTDAVNRTRDLVAYDRKLKNAVSKSIIELMREDGLLLNWETNKRHQLHSPRVKAMKIKHLAGKVRAPKDIVQKEKRQAFLDRFMESAHDKGFVKMVGHIFKPIR